MHLEFEKLARKTSLVLGTAKAFFICFLIIVVWALTGPIFHYSDTWQLIINTGTTIITFLMVFLVQNAQNHDALAIQTKLDEILRAIKAADKDIINIEEKNPQELKDIKQSIKDKVEPQPGVAPD